MPTTRENTFSWTSGRPGALPAWRTCRSFRSAYNRYHDKGFEIVSVSLDETPEAVSEFVKNRKIPWKQIHSPTSGGDLVASYGVSNIPASFLIDPEGKVVRIDLRGEALGKSLEELIK